jgi:hypothetical protein
VHWIIELRQTSEEACASGGQMGQEGAWLRSSGGNHAYLGLGWSLNFFLLDFLPSWQRPRTVQRTKNDPERTNIFCIEIHQHEYFRYFGGDLLSRRRISAHGNPRVIALYSWIGIQCLLSRRWNRTAGAGGKQAKTAETSISLDILREMWISRSQANFDDMS